MNLTQAEKVLNMKRRQINRHIKEGRLIASWVAEPGTLKGRWDITEGAIEDFDRAYPVQPNGRRADSHLKVMKVKP